MDGFWFIMSGGTLFNSSQVLLTSATIECYVLSLKTRQEAVKANQRHGGNWFYP